MLRILLAYLESDVMAIQLILCVETNKRADTDSIYIMETIRHYYKVDNNVKLSKIYLNTKNRYNAKEIEREIADKRECYTFGETKVIYCIDTDDYEKNKEHEKQLNEITQYCAKNNYEIIWFCHDVEEVYQGRKISDSQKVKEAGNFRKKCLIEKVDRKNLSVINKCGYTSNILNILDEYLERIR